MKSKELKKMSINIRVCLKGCLPHLTANVRTLSLFPSGLQPCLGSPCGCSFRVCWPRGNRSGGCSCSFGLLTMRKPQSGLQTVSSIPPHCILFLCSCPVISFLTPDVLLFLSSDYELSLSILTSHSGSCMREPSNQPPHPRLSEVMRILPILRVLVKL